MLERPYPESGSRNIEIAKAELNRYLTYARAIDIDPSERRRRAVIVTEVFDEPLPPRATARGRRGTYIDLLRPLLLEQGNFERKMCELCNRMRLFGRYSNEMRRRVEVRNRLAHMRGNVDDLDLWQPCWYPRIGEQHYVGRLKSEIAEKVKNALKSMQGEGIVTWRMRTMLLPDIRTQTEENELRIEAYRVETEQRVRACAEEIQDCAEETNSCLDAELLIGFLRSVYSRNRCEEYARQLIRDGRVAAFAANEEQEEAIENYNAYVRQCAYQRVNRLRELPPLGQIPLEGEFWRNPYLARMGREVQRECNEAVFGGVKSWKVIYYRVDDREKAERYHPAGYRQRHEDAYELTRRFITAYMGKQMRKQVSVNGRDAEQDFEGFGDRAHREVNQPLSRSRSANALHNKLRTLYGLDE